MTGEKDAPAEMPGVEEIQFVLAQPLKDDDWIVEKARAILDLFAPILAEKERAEREWASEKERADMAVAQMVKQNGRMRELVALLDQQMGTPCEQIRHRQEVEALEARALAAEAALAAERERLANLVEDACAIPPADIAGMELEAFHRGADAMNNAIAAAIRAEGE